jgi:CheY-like chemotaxis protein
MSFMKTIVQIRDLLETIIQNWSCDAKDRGLQIQLELGETIPDTFETDKTKLNQILGALLQQAVNRTQSGSITLSAHVEGEGEGITFQLKDSGAPLDAEKIQSILDSNISPAHWDQDDLYGRISLPLRMSGRLISLLGGRLELARSTPEETCFTFTLPARIGGQAAKTNAPAAAKPGQGGKTDTKTATILLVDDVEENRTLLAILLKKMGYACEHSDNGKDAVEKCSRKKYDLIIMDIQMPVMDGFEAIRSIRKEGLNTMTPAIAMTASGQKMDDIKALDAGCSDCLSKPVDRRKLERKVWRLLAQERQLQDAEQGKEIISFLEGDPDYQKAVETFVSNLPQKIDEMKRAFEKRDLKDLAFKAHALKGLGGFAGFPVFTEKAKQLEDTIRQDDLNLIQMQLDEMIQLCMRTKLKS